MAGDLDNLSARLHGRRARLAAGERLWSLCALETTGALAAALFPGPAVPGPARLQNRLAENFVHEARELADVLGGARARFVEWAAARLQVENLKVLVRALAAGFPPAAARPLLIPLPGWPEVYGPAAEAETPDALVEALPRGVLRDSLRRAYEVYPDRSRSFFYEAALDRDYLGELKVRLAGLSAADREYTSALARQETAVFDLMLAARGRFFYGIEKEKLAGLFAPGSGIDGRRFSKMLDSGGVAALRSLASGLALEAGPPEPNPSALEALAWGRYARLAARGFRGTQTGFGAVAGYLALRRLEVSNLTTVSEGLRLGAPAEELRGRMLPHGGGPNNV